MKFLCLAYGREEDWNEFSQQEQQSLLAQDEVLRARGDYVAAVEPTVTTVTNWNGIPQTNNEPLSNSRAPLAGFSIIEAANLDEAIQLITNTPCARAKGAVEVRPLHG